MRLLLLALVATLALDQLTLAQPFDPKLFAELRWRPIGPMRGGRSRAAAGVPSQPNVFYMAQVNGGVFKTTDYGRVWTPIFDDQPTGSIGAIAVSPSDPNIIYVGSGEGLHRPDLSIGDGVYKSIDSGKSWTHMGLRDAQQIPQIAIDPRNPNRLFVAVLGHPYGPSEERGIFRSTDGGRTFAKVLYRDENTGGCDVQIDPSNPNIVYAGMWEARQGPWENGAWSGTGGGIFKSTDGGTSWKQLTRGLPSGDDGVVQTNLALSPSNPKRIYAAIATVRGLGIWRSDDAGESWMRTTTDPRPSGRIGGGDLAVPVVDPKNPDIVYTASTVSWKSVDAGKTWNAFRGAPGGDDYQRIWINPNHADIMLAVTDQGSVITVNGGVTWSSWYNQNTAQMYHVTADNAFPYRLCSGQQESGSACVSSRGNDGQITLREWHPVGVEEYGYVAPDPLNPDIVYGGKITRYDRRTAQVQNISPKPIRGADYRALRTQPVVFSPVDPKLLFFAANVLWKTRDGGQSWQQISPDLSRTTFEIPPSVGKYRETPTAQPTRRGVIYAVAPSPVDVSRIWAGTDDGLIHTTTDGGLHWKDVTPRQLVPFAKVSIIDAGHFSALTAYAAINTLRLDDLRPHIWRTHDGGNTWTEIVTGIPNGAPVNVVREDPKRKGLLYAGTEREVYVSFDDGEHWQSLRLNMPATSIRDLIIKDDDVAVGTHGRGFWILDDSTPLRQVDAKIAAAPAALFKPQDAIRVRWNMNTDTPWPPDEPRLPNPPDGAIINYFLADASADAVTLEVLDAAGKVIRKYSSEDPVEPIDPSLPIPPYWVRPGRSLPATAGMHRFTWDMRNTPLPGGRGNYSIAAIPGDTPLALNSVWAAPGRYTLKLTAGGRSFAQPLTLKMDPRVKTSVTDLGAQFTLSKQLYDDVLATQAGLATVRGIRAQLAKLKDQPGAPAEAIAEFDKKALALEGQSAGGGRGAVAPGPVGLANIGASLTTLLGLLQAADVAPTTQLAAAVADRHAAAAKLLASWNSMKGAGLTALNAKLKAANLPEVRP